MHIFEIKGDVFAVPALASPHAVKVVSEMYIVLSVTMFLHPFCQDGEHKMISESRPELPSQRGPRRTCPSMKVCCFEEFSGENFCRTEMHGEASWDKELGSVIAVKVWNILKLSV